MAVILDLTICSERANLVGMVFLTLWLLLVFGLIDVLLISAPKKLIVYAEENHNLCCVFLTNSAKSSRSPSTSVSY